MSETIWFMEDENYCVSECKYIKYNKVGSIACYRCRHLSIIDDDENYVMCNYSEKHPVIAKLKTWCKK